MSTIELLIAEQFKPSVKINLVKLIEPKSGSVLWCASLPDIQLRFLGPSAQNCLEQLQRRFPNIELTHELHGQN